VRSSLRGPVGSVSDVNQRVTTILLCPLAYIIAQAASKAILITPYRTTLTTSTLRTWIIYLFIVITLLSILGTFKRSYSALGI